MTLRPVARVFTMFLGRRVRLWWRRLPEERRGAVWTHLATNGARYAGAGTMVGAAGVALYCEHRSLCPLTGRPRVLLFTAQQMEELDQQTFLQHLETFGPSVLDANHPKVRQVKHVASNLIAGSTFLQDREWKVVVVDNPVLNCYCLSSGHIVMFTGMLGACANPAQLAAVLGHEMSHVVMQHQNLTLSRHVLSDLLRLPLTFLCWLVPSSALLSVLMSQASHTATDLSLTLPYARMLETEADILGLYIMSMACYDARQASCLWRAMDRSDAHALTSRQPLGHWLSTHPTHEQRYRLIDTYIHKTEACYRASKCPRLSAPDPRLEVATGL